MGSVFKFKQFEVDQQGCAMRINTDGVLLGAIVQHGGPLRILDVGTGTGVIAMMMAQRFPAAFVDAVEIDEGASATAARNFNSSVFKDRLHAFHTDIASFESTNGYDLIVSNPPFFVNDLKNPEGRKSLARHADDDFFEGLVIKAEMLLSPEGLFWLILPVKQAEFVVRKAAELQLTPLRAVDICSDINKPVIRKIIGLGRKQFFQDVVFLEQETFYIYSPDGGYTDAYKLLLKDFFLAF